jgi:hypothetical protein
MLAIPWRTLAFGLAAAVVAAVSLGAAAALIAERSDVAEALRVA